MEDDKKKSLFRKVALDRLSSPEQLDRLMQVTNTRGWVALTGLFVLLGVGLLWGVTGRIETTVAAQGLLGSAAAAPVEPTTIPAPQAGVVTALSVEPNAFVGEGQPILTLTTSEGEEVVVTSPITGQVSAVLVEIEASVEAETPLISLSEAAAPSAEGQEAVVYISLIDAERVRPGMSARVSPVTLPRQEYGYIQGTVKSVGEFPATDETAAAFGSEDVPVVEVRIAFDPAETPTGYKWSLADGPAALPRFGTVVLVDIITEEQRPIVRLFPVLDDLMD